MNIDKIYVGTKKDFVESLVPLRWISLDRSKKETILYEILKDLYKDLIGDAYYTKEEVFTDELIPFARVLGVPSGIHLTKEKAIKLYHENKHEIISTKDLIIGSIGNIEKSPMLENRLLLKQRDHYLDLDSYLSYSIYDDEMRIIEAIPFKKRFSNVKQKEQKQKIKEQYHTVF